MVRTLYAEVGKIKEVNGKLVVVLDFPVVKAMTKYEVSERPMECFCGIVGDGVGTLNTSESKFDDSTALILNVTQPGKLVTGRWMEVEG